jgi:uncharacterized protein (TIGR00255 family)
MKSALFSMTGFVTKTIALPAANNQLVNLSFSIKSLNARFFEATCRLPSALSPIEIELTTRAKELLCRGHLFITVGLNDPNYFKNQILPSLANIKGYLDALHQAQDEFELPGEVTINSLLQIPNLFVAEEAAITPEIKKLIVTSFNQALEELKQARLTEGTQLLKDLEKRLALLYQHIDSIEELYKTSFAERQSGINEKLNTITQPEAEVSQQQRMQLYLELDRLDIHEEIVRFKTHLKNFDAVVHNEQEEKGRQLDFVLQELGREVNTVAAKCANSDISTHAINIKVELEKCREQIQNIV